MFSSYNVGDDSDVEGTERVEDGERIEDEEKVEDEARMEVDKAEVYIYIYKKKQYI